jgi:hypothetical protein
MIKTHGTRVEARTALVTDGYKSAFASPGRPELWVKGKSRVAIARRVVDADESWVILPYPEPATCSPSEAVELAQRDGVVLNGGALPNEPDPTSPPLAADVDPDNDIL